MDLAEAYDKNKEAKEPCCFLVTVVRDPRIDISLYKWQHHVLLCMTVKNHRTDRGLDTDVNSLS